MRKTLKPAPKIMSSFDKAQSDNSKSLDHFVTDVCGDVFALHNLPEVVKGALFSKYSRSSSGLRPLLEREFLPFGNTEESVGNGSGVLRAQSFYDRILDGYGDDSIGELGGAHLALENISMIAAKAIEDCRIGGSPLEKSTRYVPFDQKLEGRYAYYRPPEITNTAPLFEEMCDELFKTYSDLIGPLCEHLKTHTQKKAGSSERAYFSALRAQALDNLRGLLPAATLTNVGLFGNGRYFEGLLQKLRLHSLEEMRELGASGFQQLARVIPSFVRRAEENHPYLQTRKSYEEQVRCHLTHFIPQPTANSASAGEHGQLEEVRLLKGDARDPKKIAAALLYPYSDLPLEHLEMDVASWSREKLSALFEGVAGPRTNRRHKSPRGLECAHYTFDIAADFGCYRDLQRHRTLTQDRQLLSCELGYQVPQLVKAAGFEKDYVKVMNKARAVHAHIAEHNQDAAQYVVPMGYRMRWHFHINLRALQWLCELRSGPAGHADYRRIAQKMCHLAVCDEPLFKPLFQFVDFEGYALGRLDQEQRRVAHQKAEPGS